MCHEGIQGSLQHQTAPPTKTSCCICGSNCLSKQPSPSACCGNLGLTHISQCMPNSMGTLTSFASSGTSVIAHEKPTQCRTWNPHGFEGCHVGSSMEHHQCHCICHAKMHCECAATLSHQQHCPHALSTLASKQTKGTTASQTESNNSLTVVPCIPMLPSTAKPVKCFSSHPQQCFAPFRTSCLQPCGRLLLPR